MIADAAVPSGFSLVVSYSEAMKALPVPTITFTPDVSGTLHFTSGTWSADGKQYTANYSVTDAGVSVSGIGVSVSGAEDLAGNLQVSFSQPNVFSIDTQNPTVTGVQANPVLIADATVASGFSLVVSYSEAMKAAPVPTITFTQDVSGTLHFTSGTWSADGKQYTANYSVTDAGVTVPAVGVSITGAEDAAGNLQVSFSQANVFSIDTQNPTVTGVQANPVSIADAAVPSGFSLVVSYSEAMKAAPAPTITFSPDVSSTLHFTSGTWSADGKQYTANYSVTDAGVTVPAVGVSVTGAEDLAGNLQVSFSQPNVFSIDTQNPTVTGVQANPVVIADATVPSGFSLVVSYSEAMKALPVPTITFTPDVSGTLHFTSGTWSTDGKQYTANYSVTDAGVTMPAVGVSITGAEDWPATFRSPSRSPTYSASTRRTRR